MLQKYRDQKKIDKQLYHALYMMCKGDKYKNKRVLMETIHRMKAEKSREKMLAEQAENITEEEKSNVQEKLTELKSLLDSDDIEAIKILRKH